MNYITLHNDSRISGKDEGELMEALRDIDERTTFEKVMPDELAFLVADNLTRNTGNKTDGSVKRIPAYHDDGLTKSYDRHFLPNTILQMDDKTLLKESVDTGVFLIKGDECWPIAPDAITDLQNMLGIRGPGTEVKTPALFELLIELAKNKFDKAFFNEATGNLDAIENGNSVKGKSNLAFTIVKMQDKENPEIKKVFSFRTGKYTPIPQESIKYVLNHMDGLRTMGLMKKYELDKWSIDHNMTMVDIRFDEIAEEFNNIFSVKDPVIPCLRMQTSDTGKSSLKISRYLILQRTGQEVTLRLPEMLQDEGAKIEKTYVSTRHIGNTDIEALVKRVNKNLYSAFKKVPEALDEIIFLGEAETEAVVKTAFKAMGLQRCGVVINQNTEEKIVESICKDLPKVQNVYDTIYYVLFSAENPDLDITENQREELRQKALLSIFPAEKYRKIVEETKATLAATPTSEAIA